MRIGDLTEHIVNDQLCHEISRLQIRRTCNLQSCLSKPYNVTRRRGRRRRWEISAWSSVSVLKPFSLLDNVSFFVISVMYHVVLVNNIEQFDVYL
jgi:hypothetical protein